MGPSFTTAAGDWRKYPRPPIVSSPGKVVARMLESLNRATSKNDRERQIRLKMTTGFPGHDAESAHLVVAELLRRGYSRTVATLAGHYVATGGDWNFQGNPRLAGWLHLSERTIRRARLRLERDGWIQSFVLLAGDQVVGQRAPVARLRVVRDVSKLQRLARSRMAVREPHKRSTGRRTGSPPAGATRPPSAAERPPEPVTAEQMSAIASRAPEWLRGTLASIATAKRESMQRPPPRREPAPPVPDVELDAIDRELREQGEALSARPRPPRPPD